MVLNITLTTNAALASAPDLTKVSTTEAQPFLAAACNGVHLFLRNNTVVSHILNSATTCTYLCSYVHTNLLH